jgi:hypothetical protein
MTSALVSLPISMKVVLINTYLHLADITAIFSFLDMFHAVPSLRLLGIMMPKRDEEILLLNSLFFFKETCHVAQTKNLCIPNEGVL